MMRPEEHGRPVAVGIALLIVATFVIASTVKVTSSRSEFDDWLDQQAQVVSEIVRDALDDVVADLESVAAFVEETRPDAGSFQSFIDRIDGSASALGIGYVTEIAAADLDAFIEQQRAGQRGDDYDIFGFDIGGDPVSVDRADRTEFYPVHFFALGKTVRDLITNDPAAAEIGAGMDAGYDPVWRVDIDRSMDLAGPAFSEFTSMQIDVLHLDRVFFASVPVEANPNSTRGLVLAMIVEPLLLADLQRGELDTVEWEAIPPGGEMARVTSDTVRTYPLELPGATWTLAVAPTDGALADLRGLPWWTPGVIAATLVFLAAVALWLLADRRSEHQRAARLRQVATDKDRFLASVSHELRTPLTVVSGAAYELRDPPAHLSEDERDGLLGMLVEQAEELTGIVEDLLVAARSDIGKVAIHLQDVDLGAEIRQAMATSGTTATITGDAGFAYADAQRVRQILRNLLTNAKRYGGPEIRIEFAEGATWTEVVVADNGGGVPRARREAIFEPYESAHASSTDVRSIGLGLYISRTLARAMEGDLVYSYDGTWSRFRLRLQDGGEEPDVAAESTERGIDSGRQVAVA